MEGNYNIVEKVRFSTCPFPYETLRKQWFNDTYHRTSYRMSVDTWEEQEELNRTYGDFFPYTRSKFEKMIDGSLKSDSVVHDDENFLILESSFTPSSLTKTGTNNKSSHAKAMHSLVHYFGLSKKYKRFNPVTLRRSDVPWLLEMRDQLKKCAWKKRYYSNQLSNYDFSHAYLSWNKRNLNDIIRETEKEKFVEFLMTDSAITKKGLIKECAFKEKNKLFNKNIKDLCKEGKIGGFDLCKESAEFLADSIIYGKAPDIDLFFGFHVSPFYSEPFLHMHCIDLNLLTHSGKICIQNMTSLDEIIEYLEKEKTCK